MKMDRLFSNPTSTSALRSNTSDLANQRSTWPILKVGRVLVLTLRCAYAQYAEIRECAYEPPHFVCPVLIVVLSVEAQSGRETCRAFASLILR